MNLVTSKRLARGATLKLFSRISILALCSLPVFPAVHAQLTTTGTINGTVVDQSGAVVAGKLPCGPVLSGPFLQKPALPAYFSKSM